MSWYADDRALLHEQRALDEQQARAWMFIKQKQLMKALNGETEETMIRGCRYWQVKLMDNPIYWVRPARVLERKEPHLPEREVEGLSYCKDGERQMIKTTVKDFLYNILK